MLRLQSWKVIIMPDCSECGTTVPTMDHLVDHISDRHDLFSWVVNGRPVGTTNTEEINV